MVGHEFDAGVYYWHRDLSETAFIRQMIPLTAFRIITQTTVVLI